jgi:E3 ubiquitin-protein ligase RNF115/126
MASTGEQPSTTQSSGRREMMYCHECHDEWYRDQHGIICPECSSEFTEIVSALCGF